MAAAVSPAPDEQVWRALRLGPELPARPTQPESDPDPFRAPRAADDPEEWLF